MRNRNYFILKNGKILFVKKSSWISKTDFILLKIIQLQPKKIWLIRRLSISMLWICSEKSSPTLRRVKKEGTKGKMQELYFVLADNIYFCKFISFCQSDHPIDKKNKTHVNIEIKKLHLWIISKYFAYEFVFFSILLSTIIFWDLQFLISLLPHQVSEFLNLNNSKYCK